MWEQYPYLLCFAVCALVSLASAVFTWVWLPESRKWQQRQSKAEARRRREELQVKPLVLPVISAETDDDSSV